MTNVLVQRTTTWECLMSSPKYIWSQTLIRLKFKLFNENLDIYPCFPDHIHANDVWFINESFFWVSESGDSVDRTSLNSWLTNLIRMQVISVK